MKPGALSTLQDLGRTGFQHFGVPVCGAMDAWSHRLANRLVGNVDDEATIEITWMGPSLKFDRPVLVAITGADLSPRIGGRPLPRRGPLLVAGGARLDFGHRQNGVRSYLAVRGGFAVPRVMGSRSTYLRGSFGGFDGRALRQGDVLRLVNDDGRHAPGLAMRWREGDVGFSTPDVARDIAPLPSDDAPLTVRIVRDRHWTLFTADAQRALVEQPFRLSAQSDRMGFRLEGTILDLQRPADLLSEAVAFGTMQVPPDGNPIVLMADRQTTGGYPKIAAVASADLPMLAQAAPGRTVRFATITLAEAQRLDRARAAALARVPLPWSST